MTHAPRCIEPFSPAAARRPAIQFDGHGEPLNSFFHLCCAKCGGDSLIVKGFQCFYEQDGERHDYFADPISLVCASCGWSNLAFDRKTDGYDAEACDWFGEAREGTLRSFSCSCGSDGGSSQVVARFEYPGDLFETDIVIDKSHGAENLFSWFTLVGTCNKCRNLVQIFEYECA